MAHRLTLDPVIEQVLKGSRLRAVVDQLINVTSLIVEDNKTPFFPGYTDHGSEHIERVLNTAIRLIPGELWSDGVLSDKDAAGLVGASLLHDVAMHLREAGFVRLVRGQSPHEPLGGFAQARGERAGDLPWPEEWAKFRSEIRKLGRTDLERMLGPGRHQPPQVCTQDELLVETWTTDDFLVIGEFLRRHHARLAHEIAIWGFPGAEAETVNLWPNESLADVVGTIARSHGLPLRDAVDALAARYRGDLRPGGVAAVYLMGVLRVADYLQLDADRAPSTLLRLREPTSPVTLLEWNKHAAVDDISWYTRDPQAIRVHLNSGHGLRTHFAVRELIAGLQREFDASTAVISETYRGELDRLRLAKTRVVSNLEDPELARGLSFVPQKTKLRSADDLFRLMIGDLYGSERFVAGREMVQNASDAVRERRRLDPEWSAPAPIRVTMIRKGTGSYLLEIVDEGVGMTPEAVRDYFLVAGRSLGPQLEDFSSLDATSRARTVKAGRFGVGAFAAFLLGPSFTVNTRHLHADAGISFKVEVDGDLVEMRWVQDAPYGTTVQIPFELPASFAQNRKEPGEMLLRQIAACYWSSDPRASFAFLGSREGEPIRISQGGSAPSAGLPSLPWHEVQNTGFDAVFWRSGVGEGVLVHNGMRVGAQGRSMPADSAAFFWNEITVGDLVAPAVAVFDSKHELGISLDRFRLAPPELAFESELLESIGADVVVEALGGGTPHAHKLAGETTLRPLVGRKGWLPFMPGIEHLLDGWVVVVAQRVNGTTAALQRARLSAIGCDWLLESDPRQQSRTRLTAPKSTHDDRVSSVLGRRFAKLHFSADHSVGTPQPRNFDNRVSFTFGDVERYGVLDAAPGPHRDQAAKLATTAAEVILGQQFVNGELTIGVYRAASVLRQHDFPLARPWSQQVGTHVPWDADAVEALQAYVISKHPSLEADLMRSVARHQSGARP